MATLNRICHDVHRPVDEINRDVPAELADAVDRLLEKDPRQRFASALDVERRLEAILAALQKGRWSYRLRYRRSWKRWWPIMKTAAVRLVVTVACIAFGIGLARWFSPAQSDSVLATIPESPIQPQETWPTTFAEATNPNHVFESSELPVAIVRPRAEITLPFERSFESREIASTESEPEPEFSAQVEIPQDGFLTEVEETAVLVNDIEEQWRQRSLSTIDQASPTDEWQRELQQAELEVESIQRGQQINNRTNP